jgi:hypothetical protein
MKYIELAQKYFREISPASASVRLTREIKKNPLLNKEFTATLGRNTRPRLLSPLQVRIIKSHLGPLPKGRTRKSTAASIPSVVTKKKSLAGITGVTLHRGADAPPVRIEWEERGDKIYIGEIEAETIDIEKTKSPRKENIEVDRIVQTMCLMQKDKGNCITLTQSMFPQMGNYKIPTQFAGYCINRYFKKYPERRKTESFKAKKGLSEGTARIVKIF